MEIPRQVSPSKEIARRNEVGEGINCKVLNKRKMYKERQNLLKTL